MIRRIALYVGALLLAAVVGGGIFVGTRQHLTFDAPFPAVTASSDSAVIERGRYIVREVGPCASCHGDPTQRAAYLAGEDVPLSGGFVFDIPPGQFYAGNLTPDSATGLGAVPDAAIARALRHGVGYDGRALLPFMEMQGLSDDDLLAIVSYLRTQAPVRHQVPPHHYTLIGRVVRATVLANPVGPAEPPPVQAPRGLSVETGRYLVEFVSLCWGCHTERDMNTGALIGPRFAGNTAFEETDDPAHHWVPPNITRDSATGRLAIWNEDEFVARFRQGTVLPGSPMPWQAYARMAEDDVRSIYRYLMSIPPVSRDVGPPLVVKEPG